MDIRKELMVSFKSDYEKTLEKAKEFEDLIISDFADVAQYELVKSKAKEVGKLRIAIELARKQLKEASLQQGRDIDKVAGILSQPIEAIESGLKAKYLAVDNFVQSEKERAARELNQKIDSIRDRFINLGASFNPMTNLISLGNWAITYGITLAQLPDSDIVYQEMQLKSIKAQIDADNAELIELRKAKADAEKLEPRNVNSIAILPPPGDLNFIDIPKHSTADIPRMANFERVYLIEFRSKMYEMDFMKILEQFCEKNQITMEKRK